MGKKHLITILFSIFFVILIFSPLVPAADFYAEIDISIDYAGYVDINGKTNYPDLIVENTEEFTYKNQSIWTLNITIDEQFSDFIFTVELPDNSEIISLYSTGSTRIKDESGNLILEGFGSNQIFSIMIQKKKKKEAGFSVLSNVDSFSIMLILIIVILLILFIIVLFTVDRPYRFRKPVHQFDFDEKKLKGLNDRQKKILHFLMSSDISLTQTDIQKELDMPKASVSRNIRRLELKGLIEKEKIGMSNLIRIKKP